MDVLGRLKIRWMAAAGVLVLVCAAMGQRRVQMGVMQMPIAAGQDTAGEVYVRDSAIAMEKLALAQRMERAREWGKSADVYQEILEKYSDRVVPAAEDPRTHLVLHYTSVTETVRESLCKWPMDGLLVYRARFETPAAQLLAEAGNDGLNKLHEVMARYFVTDSAKTAGIRLEDSYFEQGDYAAASEIGKQLLQWHPNLVAERPMVLYRTSLAAKLAGQNDDAARWLDELRQKFPQATGTVRGEDVALVDSLAKELAGANLVKGETSDSWLTVGGDESRGRISTSTVKPGARLYTIPLMKFNWGQLGESAQRQQMQMSDDDQRKKGAGLGIMPAVDNGELFFQDNTRIYAMDLDSGVPLPAWVATYPMDNGAFKLAEVNVPPCPLGKQLCISVNDRYVTAVMGMSDPQVMVPGAPNQESRLVCLDRKSGRELWTFAAQDFPEPQSALRELQMGGAPLMIGDNVYVMVHGARGQFEDCYVACFSLGSGQFRWATFIANSNSSLNLGPFVDETGLYSDAVSHIAYASGRLFIVSNIGAIASLDAYTGTIAWLNIYRTENAAAGIGGINPQLMRAMNQQAMQGIPGIPTSVPWIYNPPIVQNGRVFALPSDARSLYVYDAANGDLLKQIPLADSDLQESRYPDGSYIPDTPTTLLAVRDDRVYLAGSRQVWQIPWRSMGDGKKPEEMDQFWRSADSPEQEPQVRGRAFVCADAVYLPTQLCLKRILLSSGLLDSVNSSFPKNNWEDGKEGPGNVIVTQDHVIVAGDQQIAVYTDLALARAKLDKEIAEAPADADARLHYAEVMFAGAQPDIAQSRLQEAFQLLGGEESPRSGPSRERAFNDALSFAKRSQQKDASPEQIERFFDLARAAAESSGQQVSYRLARADYDWTRSNRDAGAALALYQEILGDPAYRNVSMRDPVTGNASLASVVANKAIQSILDSADGKIAFQKFEDAAAQKLRHAKAVGNADELLDVARSYPNAAAVSDALLSAAWLYENQGKPRIATQVLRQLLPMRQGRDRAAVMEALARNYLKMPNHLDAAISRLQSAAILAPRSMLAGPIALPNGAVLQGISLASASEALMKYQAQSSVEMLPDLHLPTHAQADAYHAAMGQWAKPFQVDSGDTKIEHVDAMVVPLEGFARSDRVIAWSSDGGLAVHLVGQKKVLFSSASPRLAPIGAAWRGENLLVWCMESIMLIDGNSGAQKWSVDMTALPAIVNGGDAGQDAQQEQQQPAGPEDIAKVIPVDGRIVMGTNSGRILAIDDAAGRIVWQTHGGNPISCLLAGDDFTVLRYQDGQTVYLEVYNTVSGERVGKKSFGLETGICPINLALSADGTLVYTLPNQLCIQDLFEANLSPQGMEPEIMKDAGPNPTQMFQGSGQPEPDQLLIHGGRIFAVASAGKEVRVYSMETGDPWAYPQPDGRGAPVVVFTTDSTSPSVRLHISGNYLFAFSPRNLIAFRIDPPTEPWPNYADAAKATNYQQILFGRDYLALLDRPSLPLTESNRAGSKLTLNFFNRAVKSLPDEEAGVFLFRTDLQVVENNLAVQAVEGGIAFFTGHTIQFFMGARDFLPSGPPI